MKQAILGILVLIGLVGWAQVTPTPLLPEPLPPPDSDILIEYVLPPSPFEEPPLPPPSPLRQGINNFSVILSQDFSTNLASDFSQDLSATNLGRCYAEDLSVSLAVVHGQDLSTNLAVNLGQNFATPTWR